MVQASKDACINLAKKRGFAVENVIDAQPADGDSAHVVLKLAKGGERFEFNCVFSQNIRQFVEAAPVVTTTQATTTLANQPTNRIVESNRDRTAKDRTPVAQRDRQRQRDQVVVAEPKRGSGFNPAWLLPLLLLPLAFLSGVGPTNSVARTIPANSKARLSGRYQNDWAEPAEGGWISIQSLASDPRQS